jgi:hypothetical protein
MPATLLTGGYFILAVAVLTTGPELLRGADEIKVAREKPVFPKPISIQAIQAIQAIQTVQTVQATRFHFPFYKLAIPNSLSYGIFQ